MISKYFYLYVGSVVSRHGVCRYDGRSSPPRLYLGSGITYLQRQNAFAGFTGGKVGISQAYQRLVIHHFHSLFKNMV